ncbi:cryptochrome/photolyase family protein [Aeromicrobium sp.]|uniref:cryptochrome/photolyase family protein n=1 Tax=Aeromicrobium sp. TaxID=1871063 RepID=UPI0019AEA5F1|nr:cryptochrome/photolyase family protein [Aeromicrobium sp.]MBC7633859.1 cryptochrome/photolyase family protein [Aeromicrobium sp.]
MARQRLLFGDQLGPHFDDGGQIVLVESRAAFARHRMHRARAHLILTATRHRAAELGGRVELVRADSFRQALDGRELEVIAPTSWRKRDLVALLGADVLPSRGFVTDEEAFAAWASTRKPRSLVMDHFYREVRQREGWLMNGADDPEGGRYSHDADNRQSPPKGKPTLGLPEPWRPTEDDIDAEVRSDLDLWEKQGDVSFLGEDGPRLFAATREEALQALDAFIAHRLAEFGPYEDAMMLGDRTMAHSQLSVPLNLGLLDPREVIERALAAYEAGDAPLAGVEGFVRQLCGWRDWVWHLYWHLGRDYMTAPGALGAVEPLPRELWELDGAAVRARCLSDSLDAVRETGWAHHIQRLMVIGNFALQRGFDPVELTGWFTDAFVDGTPWVMPANVFGMSQHADGGIVATKPYAAGGAYINRMSDYCHSCEFDPRKRLGDDACPFTAGYWAFLDRVEPAIKDNHRMKQTLAGLRRLSDREAVVEQEKHRTSW